MNVGQINDHLSRQQLDATSLFPRLEELKDCSVIFNQEFALDKLPREPGILMIRGPRQFGKSTWLEKQLKNSALEFGPGSTFYLNGDEVTDYEVLKESIRSVLQLYTQNVRRLFIDEITAVPKWELALKRLVDSGELTKVLVVTTGSKATDLLRGTERLPGRKGKLERTSFVFLPIAFSEFARVASSRFGERTWVAYLLSGGSPLACREMLEHGKVAQYVVELTREWILGELAAAGRSRGNLLKILQVLFEGGTSQVGYSRLSREAGLANNTVAQGYVEQLSDLLCVLPAFQWELHTRRSTARKPCKFHFIQTLAAVVFSSAKLRTIADFETLAPTEKAKWLEWLVAQEIWRKKCLQESELPESLDFWRSDQHEINFVIDSNTFVEVKLGKSSPVEWSWFPKTFPKQANLTVICNARFELERVKAVTVEDFLG